jgi:protein-S-isoprenylcysteine O-methyltransferase Ste14
MNIHSYFVEALYKITTGSRKVRDILTPVGALFFGSLITFLILASIYVDKILRFPRLLSASMNTFVAMPFFACGLFLSGWSLYFFFMAKGTPVPFNPPPRLISDGPYAWVRNPMMSGLFSLLFGMGFWLNSLSLVSIFTPLFIFCMTFELKFIEEPELEKRLGNDYIEYRKMVPMFIPEGRKDFISGTGKPISRPDKNRHRE